MTSSRARLPLPHPPLLTPLLRSRAAFCCARFRGRRRRWRRDATDEVWRMRRRRARVGRRGSRGRGWRRGARGWCARNDSSRWTGRSARSSCRGAKGAGESVRRGRSASSRAEQRLETKLVSFVIFRRCCLPSRSSGLVLERTTRARARIDSNGCEDVGRGVRVRGVCIAFARRAGSLVGTVGRWGVVAMGFASSRALDVRAHLRVHPGRPEPASSVRAGAQVRAARARPPRESPANREPRSASRPRARPSTTGTVTLNPARPASRLTPQPPPPPRDVQESEARILPPRPHSRRRQVYVPSAGASAPPRSPRPPPRGSNDRRRTKVPTSPGRVARALSRSSLAPTRSDPSRPSPPSRVSNRLWASRTSSDET